VAVAKKTGSPDDAAIADSILGAAYCLRSDQLRAQEHLKRSLKSMPHLRRVNANRYLFDLRSFWLSVLTHSLFFSGNLDQAVHYAKMNIDHADIEEARLRVHMAVIRKALGERQFGSRYISNIEGGPTRSSILSSVSNSTWGLASLLGERPFLIGSPVLCEAAASS